MAVLGEIIRQEEVSTWKPVREAQMRAAEMVDPILCELRTVRGADDREDVYRVQGNVRDLVERVRQGGDVNSAYEELVGVIEDPDRNLWAAAHATWGIGKLRAVSGQVLDMNSGLGRRLSRSVVDKARISSFGPDVLTAAMEAGALAAEELDERVLDWSGNGKNREAALDSDDEGKVWRFEHNGVGRLTARVLAHEQNLPGMLLREWKSITSWSCKDESDFDAGEGVPRVVIRMGQVYKKKGGQTIASVRTPTTKMLRKIQLSDGMPTRDRFVAGDRREDRGPTGVIGTGSVVVRPPYNMENRKGIGIPGIVIDRNTDPDLDNMGWSVDKILQDARLGGLQYIAAIWAARLLEEGKEVDGRRVDKVERTVMARLTQPFSVYKRGKDRILPVKEMQDIRLIDPYLRELHRTERRLGLALTDQAVAEDAIRASMRALALEPMGNNTARVRTEERIMKLSRAVCIEHILPIQDRPELRVPDNPIENNRSLLLVETARGAASYAIPTTTIG